MPNFVLIRMEEIRGRIAFFKLSIDGNCQIDTFEERELTSTTYESESRILKTYMDHYSNGFRVPAKKFKVLKTKKTNSTKFFEFRSKHLRYYGFVHFGGIMVIVNAEFNDKSEQKKDILRTISIYSQFTNSLKHGNQQREITEK